MRWDSHHVFSWINAGYTQSRTARLFVFSVEKWIENKWGNNQCSFIKQILLCLISVQLMMVSASLLFLNRSLESYSKFPVKHWERSYQSARTVAARRPSWWICLSPSEDRTWPVTRRLRVNQRIDPLVFSPSTPPSTPPSLWVKYSCLSQQRQVVPAYLCLLAFYQQPFICFSFPVL